MDELDYWRLCDELNIVQAAMLVADEAPNVAEYVEGWDTHNRPVGYEAAKTAITHGLRNYIRLEKEINELEAQTDQLRAENRNAPDVVIQSTEYLEGLRRQSIVGLLVPEYEHDINGMPVGAIEGSIDLYKSTIRVDSLKLWLERRGFRQGFFFPEPLETVDFLDPVHPRYAPKLAAAVRAWQAVTDPGKRSPKQALDKWLREHAADYGMTNDDGQPIENAVEECSKVANWNPRGGATKTPT